MDIAQYAMLRFTKTERVFCALTDIPSINPGPVRAEERDRDYLNGMCKMEFTDYLAFVASKLREAENKGNKEEWIRLAGVLIDATKNAIQKLESARENTKAYDIPRPPENWGRRAQKSEARDGRLSFGRWEPTR